MKREDKHCQSSLQAQAVYLFGSRDDLSVVDEDVASCSPFLGEVMSVSWCIAATI